MDAIIGPMNTQRLLNTIRVAQNLESNVVLRCEKSEIGEGEIASDKFVTPKDNDIIVEAKEELTKFDDRLLDKKMWTVDERERLSFLVNTGVKSFFDSEIKIAGKRTKILAHTYRTLRAGHKAAYLNTLKGIGKEPRFDEVGELLAEWSDMIEKKQLKPRQANSELIPVFESARAVRSCYMTFLKAIATKSDAEYIAAPMKSLWRAIEKISLKIASEQGDCSKVCDIMRGALNFESMSKMYNALRLIKGCNILDELPDVAGVGQRIKLLRVKDRFSQPTSGGWADIMVRIYTYPSCTFNRCSS